MAVAARDAGLKLKFELGSLLDEDLPTGEVNRVRVDVKTWYREVAKVRG